MAGRLVAGIVTGGQTGVDRAAMEVARELGLPLSGWCPAGRAAEDGPLPPDWPLRETPSADPAQRTTWNVFDADATLILAGGEPGGGTGLAATTARRWRRPLLVARPEPAEVARVRAWLESLGRPVLLGVGGPRESEEPGVGSRARSFLRALLGGGGEPASTGEGGMRSAPRGTALVTGGAGYLGSHLLRLLPPGWAGRGTIRPGSEPTGPADLSVDLADCAATLASIEELRPALVIHTAYSMRDPERDILAATRNVTDASSAVGATLIHISSDMVLGGGNAPYAEDAPPSPVHAYGRWKADAEDYVRDTCPEAAIVRASLMTSFRPPDPRTDWVLAGLRGETDVALFVDELRSPILVGDLARMIWEIARLDPADRAGVWHLAAPESLSRYALGTLIAAANGLDPARIRPATCAESPEPRPRDLRLLTPRADRALMTQARPVSAAVARGA